MSLCPTSPGRRACPSSAPRPLAPAILCALVAILSLSSGCSAPKEAPAEAPGQASAPEAQPRLSAAQIERGDLIYRYRDGEGQWQQALSIEEIPTEAREPVMVIDLGRSPKERAAERFVELFDLRAAPSAEGYTGRRVPRADLEQTLAAQHVPARHRPVTMYSTSWCGYCKKARAFLKAEGIPFEDKDVEKMPGASAELAAKAAQAGVRASGVPVFDVGGQILTGFDPQALLRAARGD